jgi:hypothetical protein
MDYQAIGNANSVGTITCKYHNLKNEETSS